MRNLWSSLTAYIGSLIWASLILAGVGLAFLWLGELHAGVVAAAVLLFSIPINLGWRVYRRPVLRIRRSVERRTFNPPDPGALSPRWEYEANRIAVENKGRAAAKNCKGYIIVGGSRLRVAWAVPAEQPNATINRRDNELLDVCAFHFGGRPPGTTSLTEGSVVYKVTIPEVIAPTEEGWPRPWECRSLDGVEKFGILVTSDDSEPAQAKAQVLAEKRRIEVEPG